MATKVKLVRYVSPFGSPASMSPEQAERHLEFDLALWDLMEEVGMLDERMLRIGKPRIGDDSFHLSDMPEWIEPEGDMVRELVRQAESKARERAERFVVAERAGRFARFPSYLVIEGDDVIWETR